MPNQILRIVLEELNCFLDNSVRCKHKRSEFVPNDRERIQQFLLFCEMLEEHPFVRDHVDGGSFTAKYSYPETGEDIAEVNFDEIHLESLLTRLRQFFFRGELFYIKDLRKSVVNIFGDSKTFKRSYNELLAATKPTFPTSSVSFFKANGRDVVEGFTICQLIEARLYTGPIHSKHRINPSAPEATKGLADSHVSVTKHLSLVLAYASISACKNIFAFRRNILNLAREVDRTDELEELATFNERCKNAGS